MHIFVLMTTYESRLSKKSHLRDHRAPIAEKYFREAATGHVHWRTLVAVAERFLEVGCSLISSLGQAHLQYGCVFKPPSNLVWGGVDGQQQQHLHVQFSHVSPPPSNLGQGGEDGQQQYLLQSLNSARPESSNPSTVLHNMSSTCVARGNAGLQYSGW